MLASAYKRTGYIDYYGDGLWGLWIFDIRPEDGSFNTSELLGTKPVATNSEIQLLFQSTIEHMEFGQEHMDIILSDAVSEVHALLSRPG